MHYDKSITHRLWLALALSCVALNANALKPSARDGIDLTGRWTINRAASDDGEALLTRRMEQLMKEQRRAAERHRRSLENDPFAWEPELTPPARTPQYIAAMEERERDRRQMLGMTKFLEIEQAERGVRVVIKSEFDTRRLEPGSSSQVSLPQGQLADLRSGWDGDWFVIERDARRGPRISEKYRRLPKTDQLEVIVSIKGNTMLSGLKLRQIFDRAPAEMRARSKDEVMGPVR